jgi:hypothetical protein
MMVSLPAPPKTIRGILRAAADGDGVVAAQSSDADGVNAAGGNPGEAVVQF